ncbi:MAG TPA: YetF domain-containing protein [Gemmataceae bacterium]|nr:YetF domain-containing protein [Gemmataceae bacterium]
MTPLILADGPVAPQPGMWELATPWWELTARAVLVYLFLLVLLRLTGKRQVGQLAPFDLVLLLILSNAVQNAMNAGDNSLTAGLILATVLVVLNGAVGYATFRSKWLEALVEGRPKVLIHNGKLYESVVRGQRLTHHEVMAALRRAGCGSVEQVHVAILENNGQISVVPLCEKPAAGGAG